jgi:hypothetical protein
VSDIDTVTVDSLKALDSNRPIREADIRANLVLSTNLVGKGEQRGRHYCAIIGPALRPAWLCRCLNAGCIGREALKKRTSFNRALPAPLPPRICVTSARASNRW